MLGVCWELELCYSPNEAVRYNKRAVVILVSTKKLTLASFSASSRKFISKTKDITYFTIKSGKIES